ncbi:MAG TPA: class D sortase [Bryobacteraceae bacterium]|jgi:sortase A|nr:class D sortase [Bryobacteraceae bacterium]
MRESSTSRVARWLEICFWAMGCLALGYCAFLWGRAQYDQAEGKWALEHTLPGDPMTAGPSRRPPYSAEGSLVGRIDIPRLDLSAIVFEGTSDETLSRGVGHLIGSAGPGERGNLVLAGHRDTFFRELRNIRRGDEVNILGPQGEFEYQVESTAIVEPDQTEVLKPSDGATLTLITCYPFRYIGNAPQRFIVRAIQVREARHSS